MKTITVPFNKIKENNYILSISRYKEIEHENIKKFGELNMKTIKYKMTYKKKKYYIYVEKPEDTCLTMYLGEYIFYSNLKNKYPLQNFYNNNGRLTEYEKKELSKIKFIKIEELRQNIFKDRLGIKF